MVEFIQQFGWMLGMGLPWVQKKLNESIVQDITILGINITVSEIKVIISLLLSWLLALLISVVYMVQTNVFTWSNIGMLFGLTYVASQTIYYGYFKRTQK